MGPPSRWRDYSGEVYTGRGPREETMKTIPVLVPILALATIAPPSARAEEPITLRFAMTSPQAGWSWQKWFEPRWIPAVENASGGTLKIQPYFGVTLANML